MPSGRAASTVAVSSARGVESGFIAVHEPVAALYRLTSEEGTGAESDPVNPPKTRTSPLESATGDASKTASALGIALAALQVLAVGLEISAADVAVPEVPAPPAISTLPFNSTEETAELTLGAPAAVGVHVFALGLYSSAELASVSEAMLPVRPPTTSTWPFDKTFAVANALAVASGATDAHDPSVAPDAPDAPSPIAAADSTSTAAGFVERLGALAPW